MPYFLMSDGGAKPTGCYGSFIILKGRSLCTAAGSPQPEQLAYETFDLPQAKTNNQAEYLALLHGLVIASQLEDISHLTIVADSQLVIKQLQGVWKVRNPALAKLHHRALKLLTKFKTYSLHWIDRDLVEQYLGH